MSGSPYAPFEDLDVPPPDFVDDDLDYELLPPAELDLLPFDELQVLPPDHEFLEEDVDDVSPPDFEDLLDDDMFVAPLSPDAPPFHRDFVKAPTPSPLQIPSTPPHSSRLQHRPATATTPHRLGATAPLFEDSPSREGHTRPPASVENVFADVKDASRMCGTSLLEYLFRVAVVEVVCCVVLLWTCLRTPPLMLCRRSVRFSSVGSLAWRRMRARICAL
jgi:hypothetical protein